MATSPTATGSGGKTGKDGGASTHPTITKDGVTASETPSIMEMQIVTLFGTAEASTRSGEGKREVESKKERHQPPPCERKPPQGLLCVFLLDISDRSMMFLIKTPKDITTFRRKAKVDDWRLVFTNGGSTQLRRRIGQGHRDAP